MESQFYLIAAAVGTKETGMVYPSLSYFNPADGDHPYSLYNIDSLKLPLYTPKLTFELNKGAKVCDVLAHSSPGIGLFINEKVLNILLQFKWCEHKIFPATVRHKDIILPYFWVQFVWTECYDFVDYSKTQFYVKWLENDVMNTEYYKINSYQEYISLQNKLGSNYMIYKSNIKFLNPPFDLFAHHLTRRLYCSLELKKAIEVNGITGIDIAEII